jgi:arylsulfatase A-like enzyme
MNKKGSQLLKENTFKTFAKFCICLCLISMNLNAQDSDQKERPNVLFLAVDDLNDWVGYLKGHPQSKTPNIDKLAGESFAFDRAYCSAPLCGPSRTSLMYGIYPHRTGVYFHHKTYSPKKLISPDRIPLQLAFQKNGYHTLGRGKILINSIRENRRLNLLCITQT